MRIPWTGTQLFIGRLIVDLGLCVWQVLAVADGRPTDSLPFYANPMVYLAISNPMVTLLSTVAFSGFKVGREWIWVPLYLLADIVIWGGFWIIIRWLKSGEPEPR